MGGYTLSSVNVTKVVNLNILWFSFGMMDELIDDNEIS